MQLQMLVDRLMLWKLKKIHHFTSTSNRQSLFKNNPLPLYCEVIIEEKY